MIELYDILTLENNKNYTVVKHLPYNDENYYFLIEVDEDEELLEDQMIVKKVCIDGEIGVAPILDEKEFKEIKEIFININKNLLNNDIEPLKDILKELDKLNINGIFFSFVGNSNCRIIGIPIVCNYNIR